MWTYKGLDIFPADANSSGIRWYARVAEPAITRVMREDTPAILRAGSKAGMRALINRYRRA